MLRRGSQSVSASISVSRRAPDPDSITLSIGSPPLPSSSHSPIWDPWFGRPAIYPAVWPPRKSQLLSPQAFRSINDDGGASGKWNTLKWLNEYNIMAGHNHTAQLVGFFFNIGRVQVGYVGYVSKYRGNMKMGCVFRRKMFAKKIQDFIVISWRLFVFLSQ